MQPNSTKVQRLTGTEDQISSYGTALQNPQRTLQNPHPENLKSARATGPLPLPRAKLGIFSHPNLDRPFQLTFPVFAPLQKAPRSISAPWAERRCFPAGSPGHPARTRYQPCSAVYRHHCGTPRPASWPRRPTALPADTPASWCHVRRPTPAVSIIVARFPWFILSPSTRGPL